MRKQPLILLCLIVLLACKDNGHFVHALDAMDTLMRTYPDSAYSQLIAMKDEAKGKSKSIRMRYELTLADAQNKAYVDFTNDSTAKLVAEYYEKYGSANEKMRAYYLLGCTYRDMGDAPTELEFFQKAVQNADTTSQDCDLYTLIAIYGQMADIYHKQYLLDEELKALKCCEILAKKNKDKITEISAYELRIRPYFLRSEIDSVLLITEESRRMYLKYGAKGKAARLLMPAISILIDRKEYDKAKEYLDIFENESGLFHEGNSKQKAISFYHNKGRYYLHTGQLDSVAICSSQLLANNQKEAAYDLLMQLYLQKHNSDSISKYAQLFAIANDSSYADKKTETISQINAMYEYSRQQKEAGIATKNLLTAHKTISTMLVVILITICISFVAYILSARQKKKAMQRIAALSFQLDEAHSRYSKLNDIYNIEGEKHNAMLINYEKQCKILSDLEKEIDTLRTRLNQENANVIKESFFQTDIYKVFHSCGLHGKTIVSEAEWETLTHKFENHFLSYSNYIKSNSVTINQYRVAMLIRLGFKEGEIANIMSKNSSKINKIKIQLNNKLFNKSDAKTLRDNLKAHF